MSGKLISFCNVGRASLLINITTRELESLSQFALRNYEYRWFTLHIRACSHLAKFFYIAHHKSRI